MSAEALGRLLLGRVVAQIRRVRYEVAGAVRSENGPLEISFTYGNPTVLEPASDGEQLIIRVGSWVDPFAAPLSEENDVFVRTHGKWTAVDVSDGRSFREIVGSEAQLVTPVVNPEGAIVGLEATFPRAVLRAEVQADELVVDVLAVAAGDTPP
jgi:hypothetical protein